MSELAFCKSFLSALDARPVKISSDHIADARQYPAQGAYTLPRLSHPHPQRPNPKPTTSSASSSSSSPATITLTLKPMKPSTPTIALPSIDPSKTSVYDLKQHYATKASIPAAKIKILYKKKPVTDSKTLFEVIGSDAGPDVEFGVMVMGGGAGGVASPASGATPVTSPPAVAPPTESEKGLASAGETTAGPAGSTAAGGASGKEVIATEEFWGDLKNFVLQRIKDVDEAERLVKVFRGAWEQDK